MRASPFMLILEAEFSRLAFPPEKFFLHIKRGHSQKGNDQHTYLKTTIQAGVKEVHNFCFDSKTMLQEECAGEGTLCSKR